MKRYIGLSLLVTAFISRQAFSHGDHSAPGMIPPGLHGGVVKEASHAEEEEHDHDHEHEGEAAHEINKSGSEHKEKALFFEASYDAVAKRVTVYPLTLENEKSVVLSPLSPNQVSITSFQVNFPRAQKTVKVSPVISGAGFETKIEPGSAVRFFVLVDAMHDGEKKSVKIQVETSK